MTSSGAADYYGGGGGQEEAAQKPSWKTVYTIIDRGGGRKFWLRIGMAFVNRDQSLNVRLDALPVGGQMHIRDASPRDSSRPDGDDTRPMDFGN